MRNLGRKNTWERIIESKPVLALLGIIILLFSWSIFRLWQKMNDTSRNKELAEERVEMLREKKAKLEKNIDRLQTQEGQEEFFRENYGVAKEGEGLIVVVEDRKNKEGPTDSPGSGLFDFFRNLFK